MRSWGEGRGIETRSPEIGLIRGKRPRDGGWHTLILARVVQISQHDVNLLQYGKGQRGRGEPRASRRRRRRRREHGSMPSGSGDGIDGRPVGPASPALGSCRVHGRPPRRPPPRSDAPPRSARELAPRRLHAAQFEPSVARAAGEAETWWVGHNIERGFSRHFSLNLFSPISSSSRDLSTAFFGDRKEKRGKVYASRTP